jgi:hypothetical protein
MKRRVMSCAVAVALLVVSGAWASGGNSIASAPTIAIGKQQFGSTTNGCYQGCNYRAEYWKLPLIAGDNVTIDWETQSGTAGCEGEEYPFAGALWVWAPDTTDFSINNTESQQTFGVGSNNKAESKFTSNGTGAFVLMFTSDCHPYGTGGPYDFVVYVKHKLVTHPTTTTMALLAQGRTRLPHMGRIAEQVFTADGKPVPNGAVGGTLAGYWGKVWHPLGKSVARAGVVSVHYKLPTAAKGPLRLQLNLGGGNYQGVRLAFRGLKG